MLGYQILHPCCNIGILLVTYKITNNVPTLDYHFTCLPMLFQFGILIFFPVIAFAISDGGLPLAKMCSLRKKHGTSMFAADK